MVAVLRHLDEDAVQIGEELSYARHCESYLVVELRNFLDRRCSKWLGVGVVSQEAELGTGVACAFGGLIFALDFQEVSEGREML
jgi:hypothetical protein